MAALGRRGKDGALGGAARADVNLRPLRKEGDVKRYLAEELSVLRRLGGFDAIVAVAVKYDGECYDLTIISDCDQSFTERLERLGELMAEFVREVAEG